MKTGMKIKFLRISKGMTQGELAEQIGLTQAIMSRIESGKREPSISELQKLSEIFAVDVAAMLADDGGTQSLDAMYKRGDLGRIAENSGNVSEPAPATVLVPVFDIEGGYSISFDDGGYPLGFSGKHQALSPSEAVGENFFGCDLHGDSMQQVGEPSFKEGDRLFFAPSLDVRNGAFAFIRTMDNTATFKQVFFDTDSTVRLHPLNSRYADIMVPRSQIVAMWPLVFRIQRFA